MRAGFLGLVLLASLAGCGDDDGGGNLNNDNGNTAGPVCGNGIVETGEQCDSGAANSDVAPDACRTDCREAHCGDAVVDASEACDGANLAGATCESLGFGGGLLGCTADCAQMTSACEGWVQLAAGWFHTCGLRADGTVRCWGHNVQGELGDGTTTASRWPVAVYGLVDATQVVAGQKTSCALRRDGSVWCWGSNAGGILGDGSDVELSPVPVQVSGLTGVTALAAGQVHTCAVTDGGAVWCWGYNGSGQIGNGVIGGNATVPVQVSGLTGVTAISASAVHSCAATATATYCWGGNTDGQIGDGTTEPRPSPTLVPTLGAVAALVSGTRYHTCALSTDGTLYCWGYNGYGQLGIGSGTVVLAPQPVLGLEPTVAAAAGGTFTCAVTASGQTYCWGENSTGQLGLGHTQLTYLPVAQPGGVAASAVVAGEAHGCSLGLDQRARCWGSNSLGQIGAAVPANAPAALVVPGLAGVTQVATGGHHTCALEGGTGAAHCWGLNRGGQLGDGGTDLRLSPVNVFGLSQATSIDAGVEHSCAAMGDPPPVCWGVNGNHQLGDGTTLIRLLPTAVQGGLTHVDQVTTGQAQSCGRRATDETAWCWGRNDYGQLGDGTGIESGVPVQVAGLPGVQALSSGYGHVCAMTESAVHCWGMNGFGQLGDGTETYRLAPVEVTLPASPLSVSSGTWHTCASLQDGTVYCWGHNLHGQLGDGTATASPTPVQVLADPLSSTPLDEVTQVVVGALHSCALRSDQTVWCWGDNRELQLGYDLSIDQHFPHPMVGITGAVGLDAGDWHTCVVAAAGTVWCAGSNASGQLGNGERTASVSPVLVPE